MLCMTKGLCKVISVDIHSHVASSQASVPSEAVWIHTSHELHFVRSKAMSDAVRAQDASVEFVKHRIYVACLVKWAALCEMLAAQADLRMAWSTKGLLLKDIKSGSLSRYFEARVSRGMQSIDVE